jgi:hypothetical protein
VWVFNWIAVFIKTKGKYSISSLLKDHHHQCKSVQSKLVFTIKQEEALQRGLTFALGAGDIISPQNSSEPCCNADCHTASGTNLPTPNGLFLLSRL